jgi:hypothetical protein
VAESVIVTAPRALATPFCGWGVAFSHHRASTTPNSTPARNNPSQPGIRLSRCFESVLSISVSAEAIVDASQPEFNAKSTLACEAADYATRD